MAACAACGAACGSTSERNKRFTIGNLYKDRHQFTTPSTFAVNCKTLEFYNRMNIPRTGIDILGKETKWLTVEVGYTGLKFNCLYKYREISSRKIPIARLGGHWYKVAEAMEIQQGDTVIFEGDARDPYKFHVSMDKSDKAIKVEDELWI